MELYWAKNDKSPMERTVSELNKCLNSGWDFLRFTTEKETDYMDHHIPTLDFATKVGDNGYISYKFFSKPMASNMVLQFGTALSKVCVFSSLRQDLVRRLNNTDILLDSSFRIKVVQDYIQLMVNAGHKFSYIKSVVLQAVTKYIYMVSRSRLNKNDKKFHPLHRLRD